MADLKIGAFSDADLVPKNNEETRLQSTRVPGARIQHLKGQESKTTSKTHSLTRIGPATCDTYCFKLSHTLALQHCDSCENSCFDAHGKIQLCDWLHKKFKFCSGTNTQLFTGVSFIRPITRAVFLLVHSNTESCHKRRERMTVVDPPKYAPRTLNPRS